MTRACPDDATLERFVAGEDVDVRAHLAECATCRAAVAELVRALRETRTSGNPVSSDRRLLAGAQPGAVIAGKYRIDALVGEGGMGRVFRALHLGLGTKVAVKVLRPELAADDRARRRFLREARAAAVLEGPHSVRIYDVDELPSGTPYIVMELLDGEDLGSILTSRGKLDPRQAACWLAEACIALREAHEHGIVHRDVKPQNLVVTRAGIVKVVDFGLVLSLGESAGVSRSLPAGVLAGSPLYMSPEQLRGDDDVDARSDIWSVGATLHHLVAGSPPFMGPSIAILCARILSHDPAPLRRARPEISRALESTIGRCLRRDRAERFATMSELHDALVLASTAPDEVLSEPEPTKRSPSDETGPRTLRENDDATTETSTTAPTPSAITQPTPTKKDPRRT